MIRLLAIIGFLLSLYAYYVEKKSSEKDYKPICDLSKNISCTKAFKSKYGSLLGFSNSFFGLLFYLSVVLLAELKHFNLIFFISILSFLGSIYLAYLSYKIKNFLFGMHFYLFNKHIIAISKL